jgi:hypothetical protein
MSSSEDRVKVYIPTVDPALGREVAEGLGGGLVVNGAGAESFSWLVNQIVARAGETVIIASDRVRPTRKDVGRMLDLLDEGFGMVGLYRFAFFGFRKDLFRVVGPMDERFKGGGHEDSDYQLRMWEADIATYFKEDVPYEAGKSRWSGSGKNRERLHAKWEPYKRRLLPELPHSYDYGLYNGARWLSWAHSVTVRPNAGIPKRGFAKL